jgi:DNA-binding LacI/PurR family transcriptional regulator
LGHRRVLFLSYARRSWAIHSREQGYLTAMRKRGCEPKMLINATEKSLRAAVEQYQPTAIFCHNDWLALLAIRCLHKWGRKVPGEVSVLGIDNSPSFVALCPEITTLEYPVAAVAKCVAGLIAGKGRGGRGSVGRFRIVERETVGPNRAG